MIMYTIRFFLIIIGTILLTECSTPAKNDAMKTDKSPKDSCCLNESNSKDSKTIMKSEITCPKCAHKKMETMPTDVCLIKYTCEKCGEEMRPKEGDCCVFCTYGTHKCPSMQ